MQVPTRPWSLTCMRGQPFTGLQFSRCSRGIFMYLFIVPNGYRVKTFVPIPCIWGRAALVADAVRPRGQVRRHFRAPSLVREFRLDLVGPGPWNLARPLRRPLEPALGCLDL